MLVASDDATPGSVIAKHERISALRRGRNQRSFCSREPNFSRTSWGGGEGGRNGVIVMSFGLDEILLPRTAAPPSRRQRETRPLRVRGPRREGSIRYACPRGRTTHHVARVRGRAIHRNVGQAKGAKHLGDWRVLENGEPGLVRVWGRFVECVLCEESKHRITNERTKASPHRGGKNSRGHGPWPRHEARREQQAEAR